MDPAVSKKLFDDEIAAMRVQARFNAGSWTIVCAEFPDLVVELPHPTGARLRFRLRCNGWDEQPPSVKSVDANGAELDGQPAGGKFMGLNTGWGLCAPGTLEYHHHHTEDPWTGHQGQTNLGSIVARLASFYRGAPA